MSPARQSASPTITTSSLPDGTLTVAYAATLTASTDISQLLVNPPAYPNLAHADLFLAPAAEDLVWFPILQWMLAHKENPSPF